MQEFFVKVTAPIKPEDKDHKRIAQAVKEALEAKFSKELALEKGAKLAVDCCSDKGKQE